MSFKDKAAVIIGAGSGIGLLTAQKLAEDGARVVVADVNLDTVTQVAEGIREKGGEASAIQVDARDYKQVKAAVTHCIDTYGSIDISLYTAGGESARIHKCSEPFHKRDISIIDWGLDVNLKGVVYLCHAALGPMIDQKSGVMINVSSVTGIAGSAGAVDYSAAKSGIIGLTKSIALAGAPHGVRCCSVAPGPVLTRAAMANMKTPLGRAAETIEVVDLILYLSSDKAAFITGSNHLIDGGYCCRG